MIVGRFNQRLMDYDDEFLVKAYEEIKILYETGSFPPNPEHFKELARLRSELYSTSYDVSVTCTDIFEEICRRWYMAKKSHTH